MLLGIHFFFQHTNKLQLYFLALHHTKTFLRITKRISPQSFTLEYDRSNIWARNNRCFDKLCLTLPAVYINTNQCECLWGSRVCFYSSTYATGGGGLGGGAISSVDDVYNYYGMRNILDVGDGGGGGNIWATSWESLYAICEQQRHRSALADQSAPLLFTA